MASGEADVGVGRPLQRSCRRSRWIRHPSARGGGAGALTCWVSPDRRWGLLWAVWPVPARNGPPGAGSAAAAAWASCFFDFQTLSLMQMYRASDALMRHRQAIETRLFPGSEPTVTLTQHLL